MPPGRRRPPPPPRRPVSNEWIRRRRLGGHCPRHRLVLLADHPPGSGVEPQPPRRREDVALSTGESSDSEAQPRFAVPPAPRVVNRRRLLGTRRRQVVAFLVIA